MPIALGPYVGRKYDFVRRYIMEYIPFVIKTDIRFVNSVACLEMIRREYERFEDFLPHRGDIVFDVGSQYGDYAVICAKLYGAKVVAFEPIESNIEIMKRNAILNGVEDRIECRNIGISDQKTMTQGNIRFDMFLDEPGGYTVNLDTLDNLCGEIERIDLLKIDVEGFEFKVLSGGIKTISRLKPKIIIETHSSELRKKCDVLLGSLGYTLRHSDKIRKAQNWMDEVQNRYYSAKP